MKHRTHRRYRMLRHGVLLPLALLALGACGGREPGAESSGASASQASEVTAPAAAPAAGEAAAGSGNSAPAEIVEETGGVPESGEQASGSTIRPPVRLGGEGGGAPTSARFKEGVNYQKLVPAQPTSAPPGKVEVLEVFWYGCPHCFALDPAIESWRAKAPAWIEFVRMPAMWNDATRMHARVFYAADLLGRQDELHTLLFREIHVNRNPLNTVESIRAFFGQHGVSAQEFDKAFSSFAVESKLQRADFMNRRYRVDSVPMVVVNGKYTTDLSAAGGEQALFALIGELAAHEHGG